MVVKRIRWKNITIINETRYLLRDKSLIEPIPEMLQVWSKLLFQPELAFACLLWILHPGLEYSTKPSIKPVKVLLKYLNTSRLYPASTVNTGIITFLLFLFYCQTLVLSLKSCPKLSFLPTFNFSQSLENRIR